MTLSTYQVVQDLAFKEMLNGNAYVLSGDTALSASQVVDFHIKTGAADVIIHGVDVTADGAETLIQGYGESTVSSDGSTVAVAAQNRKTNGQPEHTGIYSAPTVTDTGAEVMHMVAYGDTQGQKTTLAGAKEGLSFLLDRNTSNLFRITNRDGTSSVKVNYKLVFLEVDL